MSNIDFQRIEAKLSAQERLINALQARIEAMRHDMSASFQQLADYQLMSEQKLDSRFDEAERTLNAVVVNMATKDDLAATESRILTAFQQLIDIVSQRP